MPLGSTFRLPQAFTTLPSGSNSTTGADGTESRVSGELTRFPRVTMNTWSCESMQVPATSPVDHGFGFPVDVLSTSGVPQSPALGSGILGHEPSGTKVGSLGALGESAWSAGVNVPAPMINAAASAPP